MIRITGAIKIGNRGPLCGPRKTKKYSEQLFYICPQLTLRNNWSWKNLEAEPEKTRLL